MTDVKFWCTQSNTWHQASIFDFCHQFLCLQSNYINKKWVFWFQKSMVDVCSQNILLSASDIWCTWYLTDCIKIRRTLKSDVINVSHHFFYDHRLSIEPNPTVWWRIWAKYIRHIGSEEDQFCGQNLLLHCRKYTKRTPTTTNNLILLRPNIP